MVSGSIQQQRNRINEKAMGKGIEKIKYSGERAKESEGWEYQVIQVPNGMTDVKTSEAQRELNRLGREGWELVSVQGTRLYQGWMYLKRPLGSN